MHFNTMFPSPAAEHTDLQPFFRMIADRPTDDTAKAVFADFLEERGDERGPHLRELANAGPFIRNPDRATGYPAIGRQLVYTELLCSELLREYVHTAESARQWEEHIGQWLLSMESLTLAVPQEKSPYAGSACTLGEDAIRSLARAKNSTAVESIHEALDRLTRATYALRYWRQEYRIDEWKPPAPATGNTGVHTIDDQEWRDFTVSVARLQEAAQLRLEGRTCAVRSLDTYLRYYRLLAMHAYRDSHVHQEIHWWHQRLAQAADCFVARRKIQDRMRRLSIFTPDDFGERASV